MSNVFKDDTGFSPVNYMINRRIGEAKKLLLSTDKTIKVITIGSVILLYLFVQRYFVKGIMVRGVKG